MSEIKINPAGENAQEPAKKLRRGVSNKTQAVTQLRFHEKDAAQNGLFIGHLESVAVEYSVNAEGKMFTGMNMPRLTFHFASNHSNVNERRHVYQTLFPVESNVNTIPNGSEEWKVNNVLNWIKHMLDTFYLKGRELTVEEEEALTLPFEDFDDEGNFVALDPEEILAGYGVLFKNAAAMLNGEWNLQEGQTPNPTYKNSDGKPISLWLKLLRHKKRRNEWVNVAQNGELGFDTFIGNGVIEIVKGQNPPAVLRIDFAKESITPKEIKKQPTIGVPTQGAVMVGSPIDTMLGAQDNSAFAEAGVDLPF